MPSGSAQWGEGRRRPKEGAQLVGDTNNPARPRQCHVVTCRALTLHDKAKRAHSQQQLAGSSSRCNGAKGRGWRGVMRGSDLDDGPSFVAAGKCEVMGVAEMKGIERVCVSKDVDVFDPLH